MKLGAWLKAHKKTQAWLADQIGTGQANICRYVAGKVIPMMKTIDKITKVTKGDVAWPDFRRKAR